MTGQNITAKSMTPITLNSIQTLSLKSNLAQQLQLLAGIETNTFQLHEMKKDIAGLKRGMDELTTRGIKIRS